jgi:hypothetical protein
MERIVVAQLIFRVSTEFWKESMLPTEIITMSYSVEITGWSDV